MSDTWIVDFGSQYTQLITRKSREIGFSSVIMTVEDCIEKIQNKERPNAIILSGGPNSIFEDKTDYSQIFELGVPILGICYGMQLIANHFGGVVERGLQGEYGHALIENVADSELKNVPSKINVWMSHFDHVHTPPKGFEVIFKSHNGILAGIEDQSKKILGLQFHPEVEHTDHGRDILRHFFKDVAELTENWSNKVMLQECTSEVEKVKGSKVLCAFSGGVDSLVAATIAHRVLGDDLYCFFVDNGLLRPQDYHHIEVLQKETPLNIEFVDAKELFYKNLKGVSEPEQKRKIIGKTFIEVFEEKVHQFENDKNIKFEYLLQGTLYPDVIESLSPHQKGGKSATIKSHHNVGGLPERMQLQLLEPLKFLFKDEVRTLGEAVDLKYAWVHRHPFPGPGLGVRILGEIFPESVRKVQESDQILFEELHNQNLYHASWQAFTVLLPVKTVGVKGDGRAYEEVICLRLVNSTDGMTATWTDLPYEFLAKTSARITNEVAGITRVVLDITSKPPGTIEWE
ncbi:MAG: glutamine-hydrolyzing GMP synthase [Halobacteriovoraceae bacterium]|nr:glutamine-hydrolyzing GMP synthase [Halobacteriovoraceae bacterium]